jgi:O-antigen/teichoic acid export membrane protein
VGRRRGSCEPQIDPALDELLHHRARELEAVRQGQDRAGVRLEVPNGKAEAASQSCIAGDAADQDAPQKLATRPALQDLIAFLTTARRRLLSGRLLVGRAVTLSFGRGVASLLSAAFLILVARKLPLDQFGEVSVALALVLILTALSDLGMQVILVRDVVETGRIHRSVLDAAIARKLVLSAISTVVLVLLYVIATRERNLLIPFVFSLSIVGAGMYNPTISAYRATGNIRLEIISEIGSRAAVLVGGGLWVLAGGGIMAVAVAYSAVGLAIGVIDYLLVRSQAATGPTERPLPTFSFRSAAPYALATTVGAVYQRVDNYLVALLRGNAAAGIYGASYRFQDLNLILPTALGQLALSEAAGRDPRTRLSIAKRVAAQSALLALLPAVGISILAQPLLVFLFGAPYAAAAPVVIVLMVSTLPGAVAIGLQGLAAITDARRFATATAASLAINIIANLILIPPFSGVGAAVANVISQTFLAAAYYWALRRKTGELLASPGP